MDKQTMVAERLTGINSSPAVRAISHIYLARFLAFAFAMSSSTCAYSAQWLIAVVDTIQTSGGKATYTYSHVNTRPKRFDTISYTQCTFKKPNSTFSCIPDPGFRQPTTVQLTASDVTNLQNAINPPAASTSFFSLRSSYGAPGALGSSTIEVQYQLPNATPQEMTVVSYQGAIPTPSGFTSVATELESLYTSKLVNTKVWVPNVVGKTEAGAADALTAVGLTSIVTIQQSTSVSSGTVISQDPVYGVEEPPETTVALRVSSAVTKVGPLANLTIDGPCVLDGAVQNNNSTAWSACHSYNFTAPSIQSYPNTSSFPNATLVSTGTVFTVNATFQPTGQSDDGRNFGGDGGYFTAALEWQDPAGEWHIDYPAGSGVLFASSSVALSSSGAALIPSVAEIDLPTLSSSNWPSVVTNARIGVQFYMTDNSGVCTYVSSPTNVSDGCASDTGVSPPAMNWYNPDCGLHVGDLVTPCATETYFSPFQSGVGGVWTCGDIFHSNLNTCLSWSQPFQVISQPTTIFQVQAIPYAIVYQPPGDISTQQFQKANTYTTQLSAGTANTAQSADASSYVQGINYNFGSPSSISIFGLSIPIPNYTFNTSTSMTNTYSMTNTTADTANTTITDITTTGGGMNNLASTGNPNTIPLGLGGSIHDQPFWDDSIVVAIGSTFLLWTLPNGHSAYQLVGDVETAALPVYELAMCAANVGNTIVDQYGNYLAGNPLPIVNVGGTFSLSATDCAHLLVLDPFYSNQGQSTDLSQLNTPMAQRFAKTAWPISGSYGPGLVHHGTNACTTFDFTQTQSTTQAVSGNESFQSEITGVNSNSWNLQLALGPFFGLGGPSTSSNTYSSVSTAMTLWNNQQTALSGQVTTECLADKNYDMTLVPYLDGAWGTVLFELTDLGVTSIPRVNPAQEAAADAKELMNLAKSACRSCGRVVSEKIMQERYVLAVRAGDQLLAARFARLSYYLGKVRTGRLAIRVKQFHPTVVKSPYQPIKQ